MQFGDNLLFRLFVTIGYIINRKYSTRISVPAINGSVYPTPLQHTCRAMQIRNRRKGASDPILYMLQFGCCRSSEIDIYIYIYNKDDDIDND